MEGARKGTEENYNHLLLLGYAILVISVASAIFAYVSSTQDEVTFTYGYLGLCAFTFALFVIVRRHAIRKIKEQESSDKDPSGNEGQAQRDTATGT